MVLGPITDLSGYCTDLANTAAAIRELDLVIAVDGAVAHLVAALGKLRYVPHWMWFLERSDSPWYRSARLFRQHAWNDWADVFNRITAHLLDLCRYR